jgi:serine/threonine-protein kinase
MWQQSGSSYAMTREEAGDYVQQINQQNFAGYSDWRLPTLEELASLMESTLKNEGLFIEEVFDSEQKSCWSVDTYGSERNWKANLQLGTVIDTPFTCGNSVRAVRSLQNDGSSKNQEKGYFKSLYSELLRKSELRK